MRARTLLPILWTVLLLLYGLFSESVLGQVREQRETAQRLERDRRHLESLRATAVAGRMELAEYEALVLEFGALTHLKSSDPFSDPHAVAQGSAHVASLVRGLQEALTAPPPDDAQGLEPLFFLSVSPGQQHRMGPFVAVEFAFNLRGRFRDIPGFLNLLTELGRRRRLAISIGSLRVASTESTPTTGELAITLPVRAYFRD